MPKVELISDKKIIPHPQWFTGFVTGEGCFFIKINKNSVGVGVQISFQVSQHEKDKELLKSFISYFKCGQYIQPKNEKWGYYQCTKFIDNF